MMMMRNRSQMGLAAARAAWILVAAMCAAARADLRGARCPIGFNLTRVNERAVCSRLKGPETFDEKFVGCAGNLYASQDLGRADFAPHEVRLWADYANLYPGGPFIDRSYRKSTGEVLPTTFELQIPEGAVDGDLCTALEPRTLNLTAVACDERHYRYCFVLPYEDAERDGCGEGYVRLRSPLATCVRRAAGAGGAAVRATWRQARGMCERRGGRLLQRGWRYANHPALRPASAAAADWAVPLGVVMNRGDGLRWADPEAGETDVVAETEWNFPSEERFPAESELVSLAGETWRMVNQSYVFYEVLCEQPVQVTPITMNLTNTLDGRLILNVSSSSLREDDVWCFTDAATYYPSDDVKVSRVGHTASFRLKPDGDGYYWCLNADVTDHPPARSTPRLHLADRRSVVDRYAIKVRIRSEYTFRKLDEIKDGLWEKLSEYIYAWSKYVQTSGESAAGPGAAGRALAEFGGRRRSGLSADDVVYDLRLKRVYLDRRTLLLHAHLSKVMFPLAAGAWEDLEVLSMRPVFFCQAFDVVPMLPLGEQVTVDGCKQFSCVGDFNEGVQWVESAGPHCAQPPPPPSPRAALDITVDVDTATAAYRDSTNTSQEPVTSTTVATTAADYSDSEEDVTEYTIPPVTTVAVASRPPPTPTAPPATVTTGCSTDPPPTTTETPQTATPPPRPTTLTTLTAAHYDDGDYSDSEEDVTEYTIPPVTTVAVASRPPPTPTAPPATVTTGCSTDPPPTTTETPQTATPPPRPPPQQQVEEVVAELEAMVHDGAPLTLQQMTLAAERMDELLELQEDTEIPGRLLHLIDEVGARMELNGSQSAAAVRDNIGLVVADSAPGAPVRGLRLAHSGLDALSEAAFHIITGDVNDAYLDFNTSEVVVNLPESLIDLERRVTFVVFRNSRAFLSPAVLSGPRVNSRVLSVTVSNLTSFEDGDYIDIHLRPLEQNLPRDTRRACAYWQFNEDDSGHWSQEGCTFIPSDGVDSLDVCRCTHLTHFAEILAPRSVFSEANESALEIISIVGCVLSIVGLLLVGLTAALFRSWRRDFSNKIWLQLSAAIFLLAVAFLVVAFADFNRSSVLCLASGVVLHYATLASFCWMLVAAVLSYRRLVLVFTRDASHKLLRACAFAWGAPCLVVGVLIAVNPAAYSGRFIDNVSNSFCYPTGLSLWLAVYAPIAAALLANWTLFALIVRSVFASRRIKRHGDSGEALRCATVSFLLVFLFGLPWVFGLFSTLLAFSYLFALTATYQGFVLFLFFVVGNKKTRDLWLNKLKIRQMQTVPVTSSSYKSSARGAGAASVSPATLEDASGKPRSLTGRDDIARFS